MLNVSGYTTTISTLFPYTTLFRSAGRRTPPPPERERREPPRACAHGHGTGLRGRPSIGVVKMKYVVCVPDGAADDPVAELGRSEEHTSELQSHHDHVCRLLLEKKN